MSAWGKTGRVTLDGEALPWVLVDGESVGWVYTPDDDYTGWGPRTDTGYFNEHLPSCDAAVLWVLRRVDPALWRQERGAWLVRKRKPGEGIVWRGIQQEWNEWCPWVVVTPDGVPIDASATVAGAHKSLHRHAKAATR